ncbi:hypothetical protein CDL12_03621 [Handroanthus impetiginosus]|uniref:Homeobox domain-containing protein n=1 Tax=Handroanthus impetiginosus TaxID=429701 RepID=A0A2G9I1M8_9LAMI|nr:hypothetical protein CDL12_03621 [Handroanthus impetiginosus]
MWMMGYSDSAEFNSNIQDSFNGRKLRPLMPRQATNHLLTLNHHLAMAEQNKRESSTQQVVVSSRWNPTPEQLQTLEELYRSGTRTPSADQIQHITAQLRRYGKIEGKNVFYWFQNHKARERQKRRRHLQSSSDQPQPHNGHAQKKYEENAKELPAGVNRPVFEVEETKKWASPTDSSTIAEKNVSTKGAAKAAADAECKADGWLQFEDEPELIQQRRNGTWQMMHLSCSSSSSSSPTNLINPSSVPTVTTTVPSPVGLAILEPNLMIKTPDFIDINFVGPTYNINVRNLGNSAVEGGRGGGGGGEAQTLELFPLGRKEECEDEEEGEEESGAVIMNGTSSNVTPNYKFFEFLPIKN